MASGSDGPAVILITGVMAADAYVEAGNVAVMQDVVVGPILAEVIEMVAAEKLFVVALNPDPSTVATRDAARPS